MALKDLTVNIGANTTGFNKGLKSVQGGVKSLSSGIASLAKSAIALAGISAGIAGIAQSFKAFISLESSVKRVNDLFKDSAKYVSYFAEVTAKSFGVAESSAYQYAATYGNLFKNITASTEENAKVTIAMMKASSVVASKTGRTMEDVMERIRSGLLGNTEAIEDLGIHVNVAMLEVSESFKKIANGRSWEQLTFYEQQQIRTLAILEQAHKNFGDEVQQGSAFSLSVLSGAFKDLMSTAGQFVNSALQPIIRGLTLIVQWATAGLKAIAALLGMKITNPESVGSAEGTIEQTDAQAALTDEINKTAKAQRKLAGFDNFNDITAADNSAASTSASGAGGAPSVFADIAMPEFEETSIDTSGIEKSLDKVKDLVGSFSTFIKTAFSPSFEAWSKAFKSLEAPAKKAFEKVSTSANKLWNSTLKPLGSYLLGDWIPSIVNGFSETFAPIFSDVFSVLLEEFALDFEFACQNISNVINDIFTPAMEIMKTVALDIFEGIKSSWDEHGASILEKFQTFKESLREIWSSIYSSIIKPIFDKIADTFTWLWSKHLKPLWDNLTSFMSSLIEYVLMVWNQYLSPLVDWIIKTLGPAITAVFNAVINVFGTVIATAADLLGGVLKSLGGLIDFLTGVFTGDWEKAWSGIKDFFGGIWDGILGIFKGIVNLIIDGINLLWGGIYSVVKGIVDSIGGVAGAIGDLFGKDWHFSMPAEPPLIPKLAKGGLAYGDVTALVGDNFNAGQDPEVISPLSTLKGMIVEALMQKEIATGGGKEVRVILQLENGETLADMLVDPMNNKAKNMGYAPVFAPAT